MATSNTPQMGYVYILTNPSFREDWIKIGKSARPVDVRSKELDNTAVPLPFEVYATMKTASFNKVETMLHTILEGAHVRIRKNREFFNVKPEVALDAFYKIADILPDAIVYLKGEELTVKPVEEKLDVKPTKSSNKLIIAREEVVEIHSSDNLPLGARYSLDGEHFVSMARFCFEFIKLLLADNPSLTFPQLETMFPKNMLNGFRYCGVVAREGVVDSFPIPPAAKKKAYHHGDSKYLQRGADGIAFYTTTQWGRDSFKKLLSIAASYGYQVFMLKK